MCNAIKIYFAKTQKHTLHVRFPCYKLEFYGKINVLQMHVYGFNFFFYKNNNIIPQLRVGTSVLRFVFIKHAWKSH